MIPLTSVVFPVPGPPVRIINLQVSAARRASRWSAPSVIFSVLSNHSTARSLSIRMAAAGAAIRLASLLAHSRSAMQRDFR